MNIHPFSAAERISENPRRARSKFRAAALDRQALAALGAACIDDLAATGRCHPHTETVGALATRNGRLVSTFHGCSLSKCRALLERKCTAREVVSAIGFRGTRYLSCFPVDRQ